MPIIFHTKHISEERYKWLITSILYRMYDFDMTRTLEFLEKVTIEIHSTEDTQLQFFQHLKSTSGTKLNSKITSGVAGHYHVRLFLHDSKFNALGFRFRENADRIGHEFSHEALYMKFGSVGGRHVTEVHDRNNRDGKFTFWFWMFNNSWIKLPITIIDIRELL